MTILRKQAKPEMYKALASQSSKAYHIRLTKALFLAYGNCAVCNEDDWQQLILHHPDENGSQHRALVGKDGGLEFYKILKKAGYPNPHMGFRLEVLCLTCHKITHKYRAARSA